MKPAPFDYVRIDHPDELTEQLAEHGSDAAVLAGGQSLLPLLNQRLRRPRVLLDLSQCPALQSIDLDGQTLRIGAGATQAAVLRAPQLAQAAPLLAQALPQIGNPQIRSRGTLCGSLAHAHPLAELPVCWVALDGHILLQSQRGVRRVAAADFFFAPHQTACQADEFIAQAVLPRLTQDVGQAFAEVTVRGTGQAQVACAAVAWSDRVRVAVAAGQAAPRVADWPWLPQPELAAQLEVLARSLDLIAVPRDEHAYRRRLVVHLGLTVLKRARQARQSALAQPSMVVEQAR